MRKELGKMKNAELVIELREHAANPKGFRDIRAISEAVARLLFAQGEPPGSRPAALSSVSVELKGNWDCRTCGEIEELKATFTDPHWRGECPKCGGWVCWVSAKRLKAAQLKQGEVVS